MPESEAEHQAEHHASKSPAIAMSSEVFSKTTPASEIPPTIPPPLPHLVWRRIVYFLSGSLPELFSIASLNSDLRRICRPYISPFFQTIGPPIQPLSELYFYHDLVWLVLEDYLDASFITDFYDAGQYRKRTPATSSPGFLAQSSTDGGKQRFLRTLQEAVRASPFIPSDSHSTVCGRFQQGDQDAALAILLPLCTRLKRLEVPTGLDICAAVFNNIALEYQRRGVTGEEARSHAVRAAIRDRSTSPFKWRTSDLSDSLPFSELLILHNIPFQYGYPFTLLDMLPFMRIPSLQRIILWAILDRDYPDWPAGQVKISCPEIYFEESSVSKQAIVAFSEALAGPCEIRQRYERPRSDVRPSSPDDPDWDRVLVRRGSDGHKTVEVRLDYEGWNPGYDHAWVSWLFHGKMHDWRRIDEEFAVQDGDEDIMELWGILV